MNEVAGRRPGELTRTFLQLLALGLLLVGSLWIVRPFLIAGLWAAMIAVATWPLLLRAQVVLGGRRWLATTLLTLILLLILVIPLYLGISALVESSDDIATLTRSLASWSIPQPPDWVASIPVVGAKASAEWSTLASEGPEGIAARVTPYARDIAAWLVSEIGSIGMVLVQFLLTVVFTAILYTTGETAAGGAERFAARLAGPQGTRAIRLAAQATRAVALGVVVTALVQALIGGIGLGIAGVPFATLLTAVMFLLAVAQIGAVPILLLADIWLFWSGQHGWGVFLVVVTVIAGALDNVLRPILIRRGVQLPMLLIIAGVIGGLIGFGVMGLFVGPVLLAASYTLVKSWVAEVTSAPPVDRTAA